MLEKNNIEIILEKATKYKLSFKNKAAYYYPIWLPLLALFIVDIVLYFKNEDFTIVIKAPFIYLLFLIIAIIEYLIGSNNLRYEKIDGQFNEEELKDALEIMEKIRNWKEIKFSEKEIRAISFNPKKLLLPVRIQILYNANEVKIASFLDPWHVEPNAATYGERSRNINQFKLVLEYIKRGKQKKQIPKLVQSHIEKHEWKESELSINQMSKRIIAYLIVLGFFFVPYLYKDSVLLYPFLIFPILGIAYIIIDLIVIRKKRSST